jgi:hypothetical protein
VEGHCGIVVERFPYKNKRTKIQFEEIYHPGMMTILLQ